MTQKDILKKVHTLPLLPGVYIMKNSDDKVIYVGKAKALKNRVSQYFQNTANHTVKVRIMVENIADFDCIVTNTEFEALVLECNLIKKYSPKYNILLKDDKGYPYIRINLGDPYPKMTLARKTAQDGARYFGPYPGSRTVREIISTCEGLFMIAGCKKSFPRDIGKMRPCLNSHIGRCSAPCSGQLTPEQYHKQFEGVEEFLAGRYDEVTDKLKEEMEKASDELQFERAAVLRDRINYLNRLGDKQRVQGIGNNNTDGIGIFTQGGRVCFTVLMIRGGKLLAKDSHIYKDEELGTIEEGFAEFLNRYYMNSDIPDRIFIEINIEDLSLLSRMLSEKRGKKVEIRVPKRGEGVKLISLAKTNAREELQIALSSAERRQGTLLELAKLLGLEKVPYRIEAYDISNLGEDAVVGGMVVFIGGVPAKKQYRTFRINHTEGQDDYTATKEMIYRRIARYEAGDENFSPLPDLILLDGGIGHVSAVSKMLEALNVKIPLFGMVKNSKHRTRDLVSKQGEIGISTASSVFPLIGSIQEEVHRFAIGYHRKVRSKKGIASLLEEIEGIGTVRRKELLKAFGSIEGIKKASIDELSAVSGMNRKSAERVYEYFNGEGK